jgi:hypothetical protein
MAERRARVQAWLTIGAVGAALAVVSFAAEGANKAAYHIYCQ